MHRIRIFSAVAFFGIMSIGCNAALGTLITPVSVDYLTPHEGDFGKPLHLIDGIGLSDPNSEFATHGESSRENAWATYSPGDRDGTDYFNEQYGALNPVFVFGLDQVYSIDKILVWNYAPPITSPATAENGAQIISLEFSQNGVDGPFDESLSHLAVNQSFAGSSANPIEFGRNIMANAVRLTIEDNHFDGIGSGGDRVGLSEIRFAAPEPGTLILLAWLGISAGLLSCRRRQRQRHAAAGERPR